METKLAIVRNGKVVNIIVVKPSDTKAAAHFGGRIIPDGLPVAIDWNDDGTNFTAPIEPALTASQKQDDIRGQISSIERESMLTTQAREILLSIALKSSAMSEAALYASDPNYKAIRDIDNEIKVLRGQLT